MTPQQGQTRAQTIFQGVTALTAVAAVLFTAQSLNYTADATRATRDQIDLTAQGQIADRFDRAIDQLGQTGRDKLSIRLGGIYSLERLMRDSPPDQPTVVEVLCAFIRTNAAAPAERREPALIPRAPEDVRAAVTVLARRPTHAKHPLHRLDQGLDFTGTQLSLNGISLVGGTLDGTQLARSLFSNADLTEADLGKADLRGAVLHNTNLWRADLSEAVLIDANLNGSRLNSANLHNANLVRARMYNVDLRSANLSYANLAEADLQGADLGGANLEGALLHGADLRRADLRNAERLTSATIRCSYVNGETHLPPDVVAPETVPPSERAACM
ncbi:pentapeptide repeat-containing protein [Micromonospora echinospora]|uniref:pentapeptide repeat-containing protein n=1 Tax=Micromonospora echinospora TaxID=1877 RepID=UPI00378BD2F7